MGLVPETHRLGVLDIHDLPDRSVNDQLLQATEVSGVSQHVTDSEMHLVFLYRINDTGAIGFRDRHRLLEQDVIALLCERDRWIRMHGILRGNDDRIGQARLQRRLAPIQEDVFRVMLVNQLAPLKRTGLSDAQDLCPLRKLGGKTGVSLAAIARANDDIADRFIRFHRYFFSPTLNAQISFYRGELFQREIQIIPRMRGRNLGANPRFPFGHHGEEKTDDV